MKNFWLSVVIFTFVSCGENSTEFSENIKIDNDTITEISDSDQDYENNVDKDVDEDKEKCLEFEDPNLEKCLVERIGESCVKRKYAHVYETISCTNMSIKSIKGLENLNYLEWLVLNGNEIEDLTPLSQLKYLFHVKMNDNKIKSILPLKDVPELSRLYLEGNKLLSFEDIKSGFGNLFYLSVKNSELKSIKGLENLADKKQLVILNLSGNKIEDATPLKNHIQLNELYLQKNRIRSAEPFMNFRKITKLYLEENCIEDSAPLDELRSYLPEAKITGDTPEFQNGDWCE